MKARQTKFAAYTAVYVLIVVAVVGVLNFLANRYNKTYDTTSSKQFTLSDQTDQDRQESEAGRQHFLLGPAHAVSSGARSAGSLQKSLAENRRSLRRSGEEHHASPSGRRDAARRGSGPDRRQDAGGQESLRRRSHRRAGARHEDRRQAGLLRGGRGRTHARRRRPHRLRAVEDLDREATTTKRKASTCCRSRRSPRIAPW